MNISITNNHYIMKLEGKNVAFLWACNSPYPGRIIPLFEKLSAQLKAGGGKIGKLDFPYPVSPQRLD